MCLLRPRARRAAFHCHKVRLPAAKRFDSTVLFSDQQKIGMMRREHLQGNGPMTRGQGS